MFLELLIQFLLLKLVFQLEIKNGLNKYEFYLFHIKYQRDEIFIKTL